VLLSDTIVVMTPRPGRIQDIVRVDLPRPRDVSVLEHPRFVELSARVRMGVRDEFSRSEKSSLTPLRSSVE